MCILASCEDSHNQIGKLKLTAEKVIKSTQTSQKRGRWTLLSFLMPLYRFWHRRICHLFSIGNQNKFFIIKLKQSSKAVLLGLFGLQEPDFLPKSSSNFSDMENCCFFLMNWFFRVYSNRNLVRFPHYLIRKQNLNCTFHMILEVKRPTKILKFKRHQY